MTYNQAVKTDKLKQNTNWQDVTQLELQVMDDHGISIDTGSKISGSYKARLVAEGHLTDTPVENVYSGLVSLCMLRIYLCIAKFITLEVWATDTSNALSIHRVCGQLVQDVWTMCTSQDARILNLVVSKHWAYSSVWKIL